MNITEASLITLHFFASDVHRLRQKAVYVSFQVL